MHLASTVSYRMDETLSNHRQYFLEPIANEAKQSEGINPRPIANKVPSAIHSPPSVPSIHRELIKIRRNQRPAEIQSARRIGTGIMAVFVEVPIRTAPRPHHAPQPLPYITHATHLHIPYHVRRVTALLHQDRPEEDTLDLFDLILGFEDDAVIRGE